MAREKTEEAPAFFAAAELVFCVIFTSELVLKLIKHRANLYFMEGCQWNWFDTFLVVIQLGDVLMEQILSSSSSAILNNAAFFRLLRILRLLRVMRLVRLMKFFGDLNVVASAITGSIKTLVGTLMLMLLMIYIIAVAFTLFATTERISTNDANAELEQWFGSLARSVLSLYEAILGGVDWDDEISPLLDISWILGVLFAMYIAFAVLALLNVITGIFMEAALAQAKKASDKSFDEHIRELYNLTDTDHDGTISREEFEFEIGTPSLQKYMKEIGIDPSETLLLFDFLDVDGTGTIECEELLCGMIRLRSGAKCIDIMTLMHDFENHEKSMDGWMSQLQKNMVTIMEQLDCQAGQLTEIKKVRPKKYLGDYVDHVYHKAKDEKGRHLSSRPRSNS